MLLYIELYGVAMTVPTAARSKELNRLIMLLSSRLVANVLIHADFGIKIMKTSQTLL